MRSLILLSLLLSSSVVQAFDWQGHRGARGLYPENTIGAMQEALKYPVTTLELDVVVSKDEKVVVSHEPWMSEEICVGGGKKINLFKMNYEEIAKFDCGSKPHPRFPQQVKVVSVKPLLSTLLQETKASGRSYNIEIKSTVEDEKRGYQPGYKLFSALVMKDILQEIPPERFNIQSFDWRVLKFLREEFPNLVLAALDEEVRSPDEVIKELGFVPQIYSPAFKKLNKKMVAAFHAKNMKVIPWTINVADEMRSLKAMGVDGIITDYPNLILEVMCPKGQNLFEGSCVKIPKHGLATQNNPGWVCRHGYHQKRSRCVKIQLPAHARFLEDGKTWSCNEGFERYRGTCKQR